MPQHAHDDRLAAYLTELLDLFYEDVDAGRLPAYLSTGIASVTAEVAAREGQEHYASIGVSVLTALVQQHANRRAA